jgi:N-methylhydantoinase A
MLHSPDVLYHLWDRIKVLDVEPAVASSRHSRSLVRNSIIIAGRISPDHTNVFSQRPKGRTDVGQSHALGIDIGGTFTDIIVFDQATGRVHKAKELTTHDDPARGVLTGVKKALAGTDVNVPSSDIYRTVHATTLFTNALIERKGAVTGLLTTEGFRDALEIGRERKYELYDINIAKPAPLAPRNLRLEAKERIGAQGEVVTPLDEAGMLGAVKKLTEAGVESLAIVFLHAYANPAHEKAAVAAIAKAFPDLYLSASYAVSPEIREYERTSTTVINAFVKPLAERYIERLASEIRDLGADAPFFMMLSNGGLTHVAEAKDKPVQLLESGPAAGALVGAYFGGKAGEDNVLAFDMGGTTAKLALVEDGEPHVAYHFEAAREKRFIEGSGMPVNISTIELIEIGAGGGSIAHVDALGLLKVGPQSSGSQPGPACYGQGGVDPTVTDADMLLGFLNADYFAGGSMKIDTAAAQAAMATLAGPLGLSETEVAWGIHDVVNENMASAARVHIAEKGKDPRGFTLLATGGAGPVHAFYVARKLGLKRVLCPVAAGVASALGPHRPGDHCRRAVGRHRLDRAGGRVPRAGEGRGGGDRGDRPRRRSGGGHAPRRHALRGAGLRGGGDAARRTLRRVVGRCDRAGLHRHLPPHLLAHAAGRKDRDHQHPRLPARARPGPRHCLHRPRGRQRGTQGHAQGLLSRGRRLRRDQRLRPRGAACRD